VILSDLHGAVLEVRPSDGGAVTGGEVVFVVGR
jgi:hypothetical protein